MVATDLEWTSDAAVEAAELPPPLKPLRMVGAVGLLVAGLATLEN